MSKTLQTVYRRQILFNPADAEHRAAYWKLRSTGKQDENLRFILEEKFGSVITMMQSKIADYFSEPTTVIETGNFVPIRRRA